MKLLKRLLTHREGGFAIWGAAITPVLVGAAALSVDASRLQGMDADLQSAADALARAGAAELDQRSDALERSSRAIANLVSNDQRFSKSGFGDITADQIRFLSDIPDRDYEAVPDSMVTTDPREARHVEVRVSPETVGTLFPPSLVSGLVDVEMSAKSVAGLDTGVCGVAPIFICNPYENSWTTLEAAMESKHYRGKQIRFERPVGRVRSCSPNSYTPGSFGYIDAYGGHGGTTALASAAGVIESDICIDAQAGIRVAEGAMNGMHHGFNTRFDIFRESFTSKRTDPDFAPAANVVKGYSGKTCHESRDYRGALPMGRDFCHYSRSCGSRNLGNAQWDFISYMAVNHNYMSPIMIDGVKYTINYRRNRINQAAPPSRYQMYRWEIDNNCVPGKKTYGRNARTREEGLPTCSTQSAPEDIDRRVLEVAVLDCEEIDHSVGMASGGAFPVKMFVKMFVTEPMSAGSDDAIYGEIIGPVVQGRDRAARDKVALAR